jgi:hypothetical protein
LLLHPGTKFCEYYACRGTSMIGAANLSPVTKLVAGTGAVSRYKVDRSQNTVKVHWVLIGCRCTCPGEAAITNLSWVQEQSKNRDEFINYTVRVSLSFLFFF